MQDIMNQDTTTRKKATIAARPSTSEESKVKLEYPPEGGMIAHLKLCQEQEERWVKLERATGIPGRVLSRALIMDMCNHPADWADRVPDLPR